MDWGTIVPAAIVGAVGLAGIGGTLLSARMTINAEDARTQRGEKRLIYANCLAALERCRQAVRQAQAHPDGDKEHEVFKARTVLWSALQEVTLVGRPPLVVQAHETVGQIEADGDTYATASFDLVQAMRDDLADERPITHLDTRLP